MRTIFPFVLLLIPVFQSPPDVAAQTTSPPDAVESGREAMNTNTDFPWYDSQQDEIKRVDAYPPSDVTARKSKWQPANTTWNWPDWLVKVFQVVFWILAVLAAIAIIYLLTRAALGSGWRTGGVLSEDEPLHGDVDRIESLPFQLKVPQTDLLAQARRHYEAGEFGPAIIYYYSYQLVQLDRHQLIRLTKGKTNRQYLREVRSRHELWNLLSRSMVLFEDVFFGHHVLDRERFESCWRNVDDFHRNLAQGTA